MKTLKYPTCRSNRLRNKFYGEVFYSDCSFMAGGCGTRIL